MESILTSIKKLLGIEEDYIHFDGDVIIHINTVLMDLTGLHVGPSSGFIITDKSAVWTDFVKDPLKLSSIKSYTYLRVKLLFDPPTNASLLNSMEKQIEKFEWLINVAAESSESEDSIRYKELLAIYESEMEEFNALVTALREENSELESENETLSARVEELENMGTPDEVIALLETMIDESGVLA